MSGPYGTVSLLGDAIGHEVLTATGAVGITASVLQPTTGNFIGITARSALVTVESFTTRFRVDGTAVTATTGHENACCEFETSNKTYKQ